MDLNILYIAVLFKIGKNAATRYNKIIFIQFIAQFNPSNDWLHIVLSQGFINAKFLVPNLILVFCQSIPPSPFVSYNNHVDTCMKEMQLS
jgi:hypothetical protein